MSGLKDVRRRWGDALSESRWDEVERLLADHYRAQGYEVDHVGTGNSRTRFDGGIDLKLRKVGRYTVVQCKHWNAKQVPHNAVHELIGVMATEGAQAAVLVTSGEFTRYARESAAKVGNIELVDGATLRAWLGPVLPSASTESESRLGTLAGAVLEAAADRWAPGPGKKAKTLEFGLAVVVAKVVVTGVLALMLIFVAPGMFKAIFSGLMPRPHAAMPRQPVAPPSSALVAPAFVTPTPSGTALSPYQPTLDRRARPAPVAEIGAADEMMTPEELAEWKRKNEESMRVLEQNVPELKH